jgi:hypothetical protein
MRDIPLQDIITAHTTITATDQLEEFLPLVQFLHLRGSGPVTPLRLAPAMHLSPAEMETLLQSSGLAVGLDGSLHLPRGPHQIRLDEETLSGWCALDTLLYPPLMRRAARVASTCPATGRPIRLTVTAQGTVADLDPASTVVSLRLPDETTTAANAEETICAYGHFFVDREHAAAWPDLHPEAVLLSAADAAHLAREIAQVALRYAEQRKN